MEMKRTRCRTNGGTVSLSADRKLYYTCSMTKCGTSSRSNKRSRKIMLNTQMGFRWPSEKSRFTSSSFAKQPSEDWTCLMKLSVACLVAYCCYDLQSHMHLPSHIRDGSQQVRRGCFRRLPSGLVNECSGLFSNVSLNK